MTPDTPSRLSANTIALHWIVAIMMIVLMASGLYMEQAGVYALYPWHKSFGVLIGAILLHLVGALKHHLVDKDGTLRRMLGAEVPAAH